jgi:hypothetical protein
MNKPVKYVVFKGNVSNRSEASALIANAGEYVMIFRGHARWLVLRCPSGCGDLVPVNLDRHAGAAWRFYKDKDGFSLYPSVIRQTGCHSHFIIWNDRVIWCGSDDTNDPYWEMEALVSHEMMGEIVDIVRQTGVIHYSEIADKLGQVPWEVLRACRTLSKEGLLREEVGRNRGKFTIKESLK